MAKFIFNTDWLEDLKEYPKEVRYELCDAIIEYAASGTISELKPLANIAFKAIKREMDFNKERYSNRWSISDRKRGGQPGNTNALKTNKTNQNESKTNKTNKTNNVYVYEYDNEYEYANEYEDVTPSHEGVVEGEKEKTSAHPEAENYEKFLKIVETEAPYVFKHLKLPTIGEFEKLKAKWEGTEIYNELLQIENRKDLRVRYVNLYRTLLNWLKNDYPR